MIVYFEHKHRGNCELRQMLGLLQNQRDCSTTEEHQGEQDNWDPEKPGTNVFNGEITCSSPNKIPRKGFKTRKNA